MVNASKFTPATVNLKFIHIIVNKKFTKTKKIKVIINLKFTSTNKFIS